MESFANKEELKKGSFTDWYKLLEGDVSENGLRQYLRNAQLIDFDDNATNRGSETFEEFAQQEELTFPKLSEIVMRGNPANAIGDKMFGNEGNFRAYRGQTM